MPEAEHVRILIYLKWLQTKGSIIMNPCLLFSIIFLVLFAIIIYLDVSRGMLKDDSMAGRKPYSWSRTQLTWWTLIIFSSLITIMIFRNRFPFLTESTLILLGISSLTTASARIIDISDRNDPKKTNLSRDDESEGFFIDLISDKSSVSIHRFQAVILNLVFGIWYIHAVLCNLMCNVALNDILPTFHPNSMVLLGLSSATYAALKTTENK
jgi:hypothetical protein